ncbi:MAG: polyribonucleotide nucleotidyltransferase [Rickettsiales bacterium]|nr:polyribonucleotide nucleotidyltransferase [Rickettsiales bacterium]|tara:strand:- start:264 stop:2441 length:2178 start_codon:yes stop_codon:yes gene_type:complete
MFDITRKEIEWGGRPLVLETGKIARQADGAVLVTYGGTQVLCTAVANKSVRPGQDFFPLTVNYQEKTFAAGKIPGGFFKREGRPSEKETLTSRLIDRPIRPLFPDGFRNETQVICTVVAHDLENDPDIVSLVGASAALTISGVPFMGPIGGCRVGFIDGEFVLNPKQGELENSSLDLIVAGTREGVLMVESEAEELDEDTMLKAVTFGHQQSQAIINAIIELAEACAKEPWDLPEAPEQFDAVAARVKELATKPVSAAYQITVKQERVEALSAARDAVMQALEEEDLDSEIGASVFKKVEKDIVRGSIIKTGQRIDGRDTKTVRDISCEVGILPRAHGSALFTRGETQALVVTTLGTGQDEQIIDALEGEYRESFLLHYNFPPYSVGEASFLRSPGRREIGHGKLAWRAIRPLLPSKEDFPYTMRVVSEVTESNGSSSMATVCGSSMSMMDAGVPLGNPVAGIAMGLIKEEDEFAVLSDILGDEDHLGDMDFKVAGTSKGVTSLQMDIKITSITEEIMRIALGQAKDGRMHILSEMEAAINAARESVSDNAPRITTMTIPRDKIREVIGTGGKVIREICEVTGAKVDIEDDGTIKVAAIDGEAGQKAIDWITSIVAEPEVGTIYDGKVVKLMDFGAFVNFLGSKDGLVHISELAQERVGEVGDVVSLGDTVKVKVIGLDRGKVKLSMRAVNQETGEEIPVEPRPSRGDRGNRDDRPRRGRARADD